MKRENDPSAPSNALFNWYPGHMARALREIKKRLNLVDVVLEIRDARAPLATGNMALDAEIGQKKKVIVLNKSNLADSALTAIWAAWFDKQEVPYVFVNCFDKAALKKVIGLARKVVEDNRKQANPDYVETKTKLKVMIVGLPNTGKSTIINQLSNKGTAKVADKPGQTTIQQWIDTDSDIQLLDTPGVMPPHVFNEEQALWLSAIHAIPDDVANVDDTAIFVVKHLLKLGPKEFLQRYKLDSTEISVDEAFVKIATLRGCLRQKGLPDLDRVYKLILAEFRKGELGKVCFGVPPKN